MGQIVQAVTALLAASAFAQPSPAKPQTPKTGVEAAAKVVEAKAPVPAATADNSVAPVAEATLKPEKQDQNDGPPMTIENSLTLRDPFRRQVPSGGTAADGTLIPELERFEVDKYKLVGVITGPKRARAMLTAPGGKMHIVSEDTKIGTRRGTIKKIAPGMVAVEEKVVNLLGQEEKIETVLHFKDKQEEKKDIQ